MFKLFNTLKREVTLLSNFSGTPLFNLFISSAKILNKLLWHRKVRPRQNYSASSDRNENVTVYRGGRAAHGDARRTLKVLSSVLKSTRHGGEERNLNMCSLSMLRLPLFEMLSASVGVGWGGRALGFAQEDLSWHGLQRDSSSLPRFIFVSEKG